MTRLRILLCGTALLAGTSCVPQVAPTASHLSIPLDDREAGLLRRLSLSPPTTESRAADDGVVPAPALHGAPPFLARAQGVDDAARAADCLTAAVYYEARSEAPDGQRAVAQVVLNRVRDRAFPGSVCGVVYQRSATSGGCQFSFVCDGSMRQSVDRSAWDRARAIAAAALAGAVYAPIGAATYYHTSAVHPWWAPSLTRIGQIGAHIFYGWRSAMASALTFRRVYAGIEPDAAPAAPSAAESVGAALAAADHDGVVVHRGVDQPPEQVAVATGGVRVHRNSASPAGAMIVAVGPEEAPAVAPGRAGPI